MVLAGVIDLAEGQAQSWETITRVVDMGDSRYGRVTITTDMLDSMIKNFAAGVYGQDIPVNLAHIQTGGAAGFIRKLEREGGRLRGFIEWTELGRDAVIKKGMRYFSAEIHEAYEDPESGTQYGHTLLGAALTIRPRVKRLDPIDPARLQLSLDDETDLPACITRKLSDTFIQEARTAMNKYLKLLAAYLATLQLSEDVTAKFTEGFETAAKNLGEDDTALGALLDSFKATADTAAKELADKGGDATINLSVNSAGISEDRLIQLMEQREADRAKAAEATKAKRANLLKLFSDALDKAEGLDDDVKKQLSENVTGLIGDNMTEAQVTALAEQQINLGNQIAAAKKLSAMGYGNPGRGQVHIEMSGDSDGARLGMLYREKLQRTGNGRRLQLAEDTKLTPFAAEMLNLFDQQHARQIHIELANGETGIGETDLPVGFRRQVIAEALQDNRILEIVNTQTDPGAQATTEIPYELRDISQVVNDGIIYEGSPIPYGGITQAMDTAYIQQVKLAMKLSNEVVHFTRSSGINWDAMARNIASNATVVRELLARRISNALQRAADEFESVAVTAEAFDAQMGSGDTIKTTNFPIVRPHQERDLKGTAVGSERNAITLTVNGTVIAAWDGTGTQAAGTYYKVSNYNLGYIQLVDEAGVVQNLPADSGTNTVNYTYATNVVKWDTDVGSATKAVHWNGFLQAFGRRMAILAQDRFVSPDFALTSYTLHNDASDAENFTSAARRADASVSRTGMLDDVKAVPVWATSGVSDLGEDRVILGQRGVIGYSVAKAFQTGEPFEVIDASTGRPTGERQAYGEEYSAVKVPDPVRGRFTSVIAYSATGR